MSEVQALSRFWTKCVFLCVCVQSLFERQGLVPPTPPEKSTMALPRGMSRTKSFGET